MNIFLVNVVVVLAVVAVAYGLDSPVLQCPGHNIEDLSDRIKVIPCGKKKCRLVKETNITVEFRFKPRHEVKDLINDVSATIGPIPLPFIGVTGTSACHQIFHADTLEPAPCPLKKGLEYVYKNVFPIHDIYPETNLKVHWSLRDGSTDVICFEVPAAIVPHKKKSS